MTNERKNDETAKANDEQVNDLAPIQSDEGQVRGGDSTTPTETIHFNYGALQIKYNQQSSN